MGVKTSIITNADPRIRDSAFSRHLAVLMRRQFTPWRPSTSSLSSPIHRPCHGMSSIPNPMPGSSKRLAICAKSQLEKE